MRRFVQQGFSLVELLTALALTMIVLAAINQMFFNTRLFSKTEEEYAALQDNARYAMSKLSQEARMAGYVGCAKLGGSPSNYSSAINNFLPYPHNFDVAIEGYNTSQVLPAELPSTQIKTGTDILVIRRADSDSFRMLRPKTDSTLNIEYVSQVANACTATNSDKINGLCPGDIVILADCEKAKSFVITSITTILNGNGDREVVVNHAGGENNPPVWGGPTSEIAMDKFDPQSAQLSKAATTAYFIDNNYALRRQVNSSKTEIVVQGVENMHILYGVDTDGDGSVNRYVDATLLSADPLVNQPLHFRNVVSIRLALLMRSDEAIATQQEQTSNPVTSFNYTFLDLSMTADITDGHIRQAFDNTVYLRNNRGSQQQ